MAIFFTNAAGLNARTGNWTTLQALPGGMEPMRYVSVSCASDFMIGHCTAGQATDDAGFMFCAAGRHNFGLVNYPQLTVRAAGTGTPSIFVVHYATGDQWPEGSG
jgi:hypothetical protein